MSTTVAIVGGGYGGVTTAKALDEVADVVLVEPQDTFVHNVAALRGLVDPAWTDRLFLPFDRLLQRGRILHETATRVDATGVTLASGARVDADYIVLATGSGYPFPAKVDVHDRSSATAKFRVAHRALAGAERVLLLGAGPVGLELAGEIKAAWADKTVTIVDPADDVLSGSVSYPQEFRAELRRQLDGLGVEFALGTSLREQPPVAAGAAHTFTATLHSGQQLTADIWFRCFGAAPVTDYLGDGLATARQADGRLAVTPELRLRGQERVFAVGDITATPEAKRAAAAEAHARVVAANIRALLHSGTQAEPTPYQPGPEGIVVPLGPKGGATFAPGWEHRVDAETAAQIRDRAARERNGLLDRDILDAETTMQLKSADLMVGRYTRLLGLE
jgi:NADH dehydrogenase FAD-containing subunit